MDKTILSKKLLSNQEAVKITDLPFVKKRTKERDGNCFWNVKPTDNYPTDCQTGATYGALALEFMEKDDFQSFLGWCVGDMPNDWSGIEIGFLAFIARAALSCKIPARAMLARREKESRQNMKALAEIYGIDEKELLKCKPVSM